jgi:hypothetical protein
LDYNGTPSRPERLSGPPGLLSNGYQGLFPCGWSGRGLKLTTHLHLVPRSKNEWICTSTPQYGFMAWCSVKKEHRDNFSFTNALDYNRTLSDKMQSTLCNHEIRQCLVFCGLSVSITNTMTKIDS